MTEVAKATDGSTDKAVSLLALRADLQSTMHNLWTVYVVATFAAAGFGSSGDRSFIVAVAVTIGFWLFTCGHLALLRQTLLVVEAIRLDLAEVKLPNTLLPRTLKESAGNANPLLNSTLIHLGIDLCVTAAIWARFIL